MTATPVKFLVATPKKISYFSNNREEDLILFADIYDENGRISRNALTHDGVGFYSTELLTFTTKVFRDIRFINNLNNVLSRTRLIVEDVLAIDINAVANAIVTQALASPEWIEAFRPLTLGNELIVTDSSGSLRVRENRGILEIIDGDREIIVKKTNEGIVVEDATGLIIEE